jgi:hypothetical protein
MSKGRRSGRGRSGSQSSPAAPITPAPPSRGVSTSRRTSPEEFAEEYSYVTQDLRRILILAIIMFAIMIGLNLVLH